MTLQRGSSPTGRLQLPKRHPCRNRQHQPVPRITASVMCQQSRLSAGSVSTATTLHDSQILKRQCKYMQGAAVAMWHACHLLGISVVTEAVCQLSCCEIDTLGLPVTTRYSAACTSSCTAAGQSKRSYNCSQRPKTAAFAGFDTNNKQCEACLPEQDDQVQGWCGQACPMATLVCKQLQQKCASSKTVCCAYMLGLCHFNCCLAFVNVRNENTTVALLMQQHCLFFDVLIDSPPLLVRNMCWL